MVVMTPSTTTEISSIPQGLLSDSSGLGQQVHPDVGVQGGAVRSGSVGRGMALSKAEILAALQVFNGNRTKTAQYLGISRRYLQYKLREYGVPHRYQKEL